jgi:hypothetical protein
MSTTTVHGRIQRERVLRHASAPITGLANALWRVVARAYLDLQAAHTAHAQARRVADETAEARSLAQHYAKTDPGFAADLSAAVMRHESAA